MSCLVLPVIFFSCELNRPSDENFTQKVITMSWWGGDERHEATLKAVEAFMSKNPDIRVEIQFGAWDGWEDKMSAAFFSDTAPDVNQINWNWITAYSADGSKFADMNKLGDYFDLSQYSESALRLCTVAGELQAIPVSMTGRIFYWNKAVFDRAGLSLPDSLDALYTAGEVFRERLGEDCYPLALGEYDRMILMVYYLESVYGREWVSGGELSYTEEEIAAGMRFIQSLEDAHVIPSVRTILGDGASSFDKNPKWINGMYGGIFEWDTSASKFAAALGDGGVFEVGSHFDDFGKYNGGFSKVALAFAVSQTAEHPEECAELLNFLLNDPEGAAIMASERGIPLSQSAFKVCSESALINPILLEANSRIMEQTSFLADPFFEDSRLRGTDGVYYDVFGGLSYGDYAADEAAGILAGGIRRVLAAGS